MTTALALFTRDLRVYDQPVLAAAARADATVAAFVLDDAILASADHRPNRTGFLLECLSDLDTSLHGLGAGLVVRRGTWVDEVMRLARAASATEIHVSDDVSGYARRRITQLEREARGARVAVHRHDGVTVVPPGAITPGGDDHFKVFTPYHRRWVAYPRRPLAELPARLRPVAIDAGSRPRLEQLSVGHRSPRAARGGESAGRRQMHAWTRASLARYSDCHDDLAGDATSRLSPYLHFGCVSPTEIVATIDGRAGADAYLRQLCWRDFYHQILAVRPDAAWSDYRNRGDVWNDDPAGLQAWREGRTGYPVVDAGMRQLAREGFMHNRARLIAASFLTTDLYVDWRLGARHFLDLLLDGDIANNNLNWQWSAGTGTDTNPHRVFNPTVQGQRFDPDGAYVRRYVPELVSAKGKAVHTLGPLERERLGYPQPIVDHADAIAAHKARRAR